MAADDSGRVSVSKDFLTTQIQGLELRLIEKLATKADVDDLRKDVDSLKRWRAFLAGAAAAAVAMSSGCVAFVIYSLTHIR